jgi:hypothetical protein
LRLTGGRSLICLPLAERCALAICFALSAAGWGTALLLGGSAVLRISGSEIVLWVLALHVTAVSTAVVTAVMVGAASRGVRQPAQPGLSGRVGDL